jgi:hypothetical protein
MIGRRKFITLLGGAATGRSRQPRVAARPSAVSRGAQVFVLGDDYCAETHDDRYN